METNIALLKQYQCRIINIFVKYLIAIAGVLSLFSDSSFAAAPDKHIYEAENTTNSERWRL